MNLPEDLKYTEEHEWVRVENDHLLIGITDYAQGELGDIVFIELPTSNDKFDKSSSFGTVEAVKTVSDLYMPVSGVVVEVNEDLETSPELINEDPYESGWIIKVKPDNTNDINDLLDANRYKEIIS